MIRGMNHAVLYVRDAQAHRRFYEDVLGFSTIIDGPGPFVFMRAPASNNHHDIAFFTIGAGAGPSDAGRTTVGLYHLAWEVGTLDELAVMRDRLRAAGALKGESEHHYNKSLYCHDPDGIEFEVTWILPADEWAGREGEAIVEPLDLERERARYGGSLTSLDAPADRTSRELT
jgi:catechol-2,3-dioxygenase